MLGHLKGEVFGIKGLLVDLTDEEVEELLRHDGLAGEEVDAVVGACQEGGPAVILNGVLLTVEVAHEGDGVVDAWREGEELLLELTSGALVEEISHSTDELASWQLVTAEVVSEEFSCIS